MNLKSYKPLLEKDEVENKENSSVEGIISKLQQIGNYESFISALKGLKPNQKELFIKEFGVVDAIKPSAANTDIPVTQLRPTQSEIDWKKSLSYGLGQDCSYFFKDPVKLGSPVLTYKDKYIIDGHHRWSQIFMFNPRAKASCINFDYDQGSVLDVLKDFQGAVLATTGKVAVGTAGTNIWSVSEKELRSYIDENMTDACWESLVKEKVATDRNSAIEYIIKNALLLQNKIRPAQGAPDRVDMPQTTPEVIKKAHSSLSDMSEELDDDVSDLIEKYYDDELGNGWTRDTEYYPGGITRGNNSTNKAPQWWKDKGGTDASWKSAQRQDRELNKERRP